jgi:hypothetical protein
MFRLPSQSHVHNWQEMCFKRKVTSPSLLLDIEMGAKEIGLRMWPGLFWVRIVFDEGSCEQGDEPSNSKIGAEFLY